MIHNLAISGVAMELPVFGHLAAEWSCGSITSAATALKPQQNSSGLSSIALHARLFRSHFDDSVRSLWLVRCFTEYHIQYFSQQRQLVPLELWRPTDPAEGCLLGGVDLHARLTRNLGLPS